MKSISLVGSIQLTPEEEADDIETKLDADSLSVLSEVSEAYGHLPAVTLMQESHSETPWQDAFSRGSGTVIPKEVMQRYYKDFL